MSIAQETFLHLFPLSYLTIINCMGQKVNTGGLGYSAIFAILFYFFIQLL